MGCRRCDGKPVVNLREHKLSLCKDCYISWFIEYTEKTIRKFRMLSRDDRVLVAVSGGKDSLALWDVLNELGYETSGLYINLGINHNGYSDVSLQKSREFAQKIGRELVVVNIEEEFGLGIPGLRNITQRPLCSACGMTKRYYMNKIALDLGVSVLATGHNLDDETSQLLGNILNWSIDYLTQQSPVLPGKEEEGLRRKVKPFCYFTEKQTLLYTLLRDIDYVGMECPFSVGATTLSNKEILNQLEHRSPGIKRRFYDGFLKNKRLFNTAEVTVELKKCSTCGMPTVNEVCSFCRTKEKAQSVRFF